MYSYSSTSRREKPRNTQLNTQHNNFSQIWWSLSTHVQYPRDTAITIKIGGVFKVMRFIFSVARRGPRNTHKCGLISPLPQ